MAVKKAATKAPAEKTPAKKTAAKKTAAKKTAAKKAPAKKAAAAKAESVTKAATKKDSAAKVPAKKESSAKASTKKAAADKSPAKKAAAKQVETPKTPAKKADTATAKTSKPAEPKSPPRPTSAGLDKAFLDDQRKELADLRAEYITQAEEYEAEADLLAQELETGDVGFDEEAGEGGAATVDRERNLVLAAKARQNAEEIDQAVRRIEDGSYGLCLRCGQKIPKMRLKAIPHAELCVDCKTGGLLRRR